MSASLLSKSLRKDDTFLVIKPFIWEYWDVLWELRRAQLAEYGIRVDSTPRPPDLNSPYERDYHRMQDVYLKGKGNFWIAWYLDHPVGHIGAQDIGDYIELRRMYVRERYRRRGIGTQLVITLVTHCRQHGVNRIELWTEKAGPGQMLYKKSGFHAVKDVSESEKFATNTSGEIRMALSLGS